MASKYPMRALRIDDELYAKLCRLADKDERSFNAECTYALKLFVAEQERRYGKIPVDTPDTEGTQDNR